MTTADARITTTVTASPRKVDRAASARCLVHSISRGFLVAFAIVWVVLLLVLSLSALHVACPLLGYVGAKAILAAQPATSGPPAARQRGWAAADPQVTTSLVAGGRVTLLHQL